MGTYVIERHFWPFATHRNTDLLYNMHYDPGLSPFLLRNEKMLRAVFTTYVKVGVAAGFSVEPAKRRGAVKEKVSDEECRETKKRQSQMQQGRSMALAGLEALLTDSGLLGGTLDLRNVRLCF